MPNSRERGNLSRAFVCRFVSGSSKTKENATPYEVDITQAAEQATITAGTA